MYREISHSSHGSVKYSFGWSSTVGFLNNEIINKYKQLCEKSKDNQIKDNSVIYLSPLSSYPVYKLKNYIQENKLNITKARKWDKIDTIIIDKDFFTNIDKIENENYTLIPAKEILDNKNKYIGDKNYQYVNNNNFTDIEFFYTNSDNIVSFKKEFGQFKDYPQIKGIKIQRHHGMKNICDNIEFITELFENIEKYNLHVIIDDSINKETNKETVIDIEIYENLYGMLNSTDVGNWKLAKEIIANCEYNQSRPYILYLASVFNQLNTKSDNKNYHFVYKNLNKEQKYFSYNKWNNHFEIIKLILDKYPEYKHIFSQCIKIHFNTLYKIELIQEIIFA
jgi:hypothetical protein